MTNMLSKAKYSKLAEELANFLPPSKMTPEQTRTWAADVIDVVMQAQHHRAGLAKIVLDTLVYDAIGTGLAAFACNVFKEGSKRGHPAPAFIAAGIMGLIAVGIVFTALYVGIDALDDKLKVGKEPMGHRALFGYVALCMLVSLGSVIALFMTAFFA